jgi:hypothetical protein
MPSGFSEGASIRLAWKKIPMDNKDFILFLSNFNEEEEMFCNIDTWSQWYNTFFRNLQIVL